MLTVFNRGIYIFIVFPNIYLGRLLEYFRNQHDAANSRFVRVRVINFRNALNDYI